MSSPSTRGRGDSCPAGGSDFQRNKFNHVTVAWRQPASFKPFIYRPRSRRASSGHDPVNDEPIVISASQTGSQAWSRITTTASTKGPMKMRTALAKSKNMVSIRILQSIGTHYAQDFATRFGFDAARHPPYLTMAPRRGFGHLGRWSPLTRVRQRRLPDQSPGRPRNPPNEKTSCWLQAAPVPAGENAAAIDPETPSSWDSMLRDVTIYGTGAKAFGGAPHGSRRQDRSTNEYVDARFCGYPDDDQRLRLVGFDQPSKARRQGNRRRHGAADLDRLHGPRGSRNVTVRHRNRRTAGRRLRQRP